MKVLCCLYGFLLEGFISSGFVGCLLIVLLPYLVIFGVMGLLCLILNHLGSLHIVLHLVMGSFYVIGMCT
jgi:hypothetical protein